ncbi:hypothetical protein HRbin40_00757 [bacterium HR40]|nr:hypothetical protein HRbin40_00757 [bacterium HR40]
MFGLSLGELLLLLVLAVVVWRGFALFQRAKDRRARPAPRTGRRSHAVARPVDLVACPLCGTYVPHDAAPCRSTTECRFAGNGGPPAARA